MDAPVISPIWFFIIWGLLFLNLIALGMWVWAIFKRKIKSGETKPTKAD